MLITCLIGNKELLCTQCGVIGPRLVARRKSHWFSRIAAGTWGIFSSYGRNGHSKLELVHQRQDSCLVTTDTSGIYTRPGRTIRTLLEVRQKTEFHFVVGTMILQFLSIFKKSQALSPFEALNSMCLWRCRRDVRPPVQMSLRPKAFFGSPQGMRKYLHLMR